MASTYTPGGIELIADGEQSNTWGDTTNTNWELIEEMVAGVVSIALTSTSYTLTTSDGASSNGRHAVIVFTGIPGGTCTVTVSPNDLQKVYYIKNSTDQDVTMTQGSGSNVTVASGDTKILYCDGAGASANVVSVISSEFTTLDATTANITTANITTFNLGGTNVTSTAAELNILDGVTSTTAELNILDGVTASAAELNTMDGITATTTELNYVDGVTSAIQTQLDAKAALAGGNFTGNVDVDATLTANILAIDNGSNDWTLEVSSNNLIFKYGGTAKMKLDSSGNLTVTGNVTGYGTI